MDFCRCYTTLLHKASESNERAQQIGKKECYILLELVDTITQKGATIHFKKENLTFNSNTNDPVQKLMLTMIGAVAEMERELIASRVREGVALAKLNHKYKGGKKKLSDEQVKILNDMYAKHYSLTKIAKELHISRPTVYSYLRDIQ